MGPALRRWRTWAAFAASVTSTVLASLDERFAWTIVVAITTGLLAGFAIVFPPEHEEGEAPVKPDPEERFQAEVARIVARYEAEQAPRLRRRAAGGGDAEGVGM